MAKLGLRVNGKEFAGWKSIRVTRGIECIAGTFELSVTNRWQGHSKPWPIYEEDECTVVLDGKPLITGYVDKRRVSLDPNSVELMVGGRDRAGALVDCSANLGKWEFQNLSILTLAKELAKPFGVPVRMDSGVRARAVATDGSSRTFALDFGTPGESVASTANSTLGLGLPLPTPPRKFSIDPGESCFEVLEKACRTAGVLAVSDGAGGIVLTRAGRTRIGAQFVEGQNVLGIAAEYECSGRFRRYLVMGQHQGDNEWFAEQVCSVKGSATDNGVKRTSRVLVVRGEGNATPESAGSRAAWEAKVRAARGDTVTVRVRGWTQADGTVWPINALARVKSPTVGVDGDMLISQVELSLDVQGGEVAQLTFRRPDAFKPEPVITKDGLWKEIARGVR